MKKLLILFILLALASCANMMGNRTVNVSEMQIQQKLNEKLAIPFSLLKVFDVNLSNSQVTFDQTTGRMHTTMDTNLTSALFNESMSGKLGISGKLRFDATTSSVVLDEPKVEQFNLVGASGQYNDLLNALANAVGGQMLNGLTLYTIKPEDLKVGHKQYTPKGMQVTDTGLQLTLSPQ